jgi:general secretion pathway protein N
MRAVARGWLLAAGICIYLVALTASLPATLADAGLNAASGGRMRVADAQGTLWSGTGHFEVRAAGGRSAYGMPLAWQFRPGELMRARIGYSVRAGAGSEPFPVTISWSRVEVSDVRINLPASALVFGAPALAPLALSGQLQVEIPGFSVGRGSATGEAVLRWRAAGSALSPVSPLGDYEVRLAADGAAIHASLATLQGPLQLDGGGAWQIGARPAFLATARMPAELQAQLAPFLRLIAVERGDRSFEILAR